MERTPVTPSFCKAGWAVGLLLVFFSCHDAPRDNPFDPALTPPVELTVALDDTAGTATLTWTPYEGQQPFQEYRVLRNIADRKSVDTLAHIPAVEQTAFVDTTLEPNTAYGYRLAVVNAGGYAAVSEERSVTGYAAGPVSLVAVEVDARQGQAQVRWTQFQGGRFTSYRVERRSGEEEGFGVVARLSGVQDTVYVDGGLEPEGVYFYRVVVEAGGQEWASAPSSRQGFALEPVPLLGTGADSEEGAIRLRWGQFAGPGFSGYQVRRRAVGTDQEEVLAELSAVVDTSLVDSSALAGVDYEYRVVVQAAGQELSSNSRVARLELPAVWIAQVEFNSAKASASVRWSQYAGPRFRAYRVERRTAELATQVIEEVEDIADTSWVDSGLAGNTEYFYRVVVETERGEEVESEEQSGAFHQLLATWPLEPLLATLRPLGQEGRPFVRLCAEGDRIAAMVTNNLGDNLLATTTSLWTFDGEGQLLTKPDTIPYIPDFGLSTATVRIAEGHRFFALAKTGYGASGQKNREGDFAILEQVPGGAFLLQEHALSTEALPQLMGEAWQNFRQERKVRNFGFGASVPHRQTTQKTDSVYRLLLSLDLFKQDAELDWFFTPPDSLHLEPQEQHITEPLQVIETLFYQLRLEAVQGEVRAAVLSPAIASGVIESGIPWTSLALIGDTPVLTAYDQPYILTQGKELVPLAPFEAGVSELRVWEGRRRGSTQVGVCLPKAGQLLLGTVLEGQEADWPTSLINSLGPSTGRPADLLSYPLSFDVGPDGRIYVLDAGNARIVVFDSSRRYVTQWGRWGEGEGEFDFGRGARSPAGELDFAGSIAVDDQGYIYVADEINKRIQRFAP